MPEHTEELERMRADVHAAREQVASALGEMRSRVTAPIDAARSWLDVPALIRHNPLASVAAAVGLGVFIAATGADEKAATAAADSARDAAAATARAIRETPAHASAAREQIGDLLSRTAASLALAFISHLRDDTAATPVKAASPSPVQPS